MANSSDARRKLTPGQVRAIREEYANSAISQEGLAGKYGVGHTAIGSVINWKRWRHIDGAAAQPRKKVRGADCGRAKLSAGEVVAIRREFTERRITKARLAAKYFIDPSSLTEILCGETWGHVGGPRTPRRSNAIFGRF